MGTKKCLTIEGVSNLPKNHPIQSSQKCSLVDILNKWGKVSEVNNVHSRCEQS